MQVVPENHGYSNLGRRLTGSLPQFLAHLMVGFQRKISTPKMIGKIGGREADAVVV